MASLTRNTIAANRVSARGLPGLVPALTLLIQGPPAQ
jgi:hypothetical protein